MASTATQIKSARRSRNARSPTAGEIVRPETGSFLGRTEELAELSELLERERLVTLTGAPGIGKSRLALELAGRLGGDYPGGARLVELARSGDVGRAVATAFSFDEVTGRSLTDTLLARLRRRRVLLVLDNCEHLLGACAELSELLLGGCPQLRILATSREALKLAGERIWPVPPLAVPPKEDAPPETLAGYAAVALFCERAACVQPGFSLNPYLAPAVAEISRRLDGIPLAIELAAGRVESLTPQEIASRLNDRFHLLTEGGPSVLAHHQTLEAALDWSHELLSAPECALLRRLAVFLGGFEPEAVAGICAGGQVKGGQVPKLLEALVAKSLVVAEQSDAPKARYRLLETIRAYAAERLEQAGETAALRRRHARFYLELAERAEPELTGPDQERWFDRLDAERANLRLALEWSLSHGEPQQALRLAGALVLFWRVRCHFGEGRELLEAAVSTGDRAASGLRAKALWGAGFMIMMTGDYHKAAPFLEESLSRFEELGDVEGRARALLILGNIKQILDTDSALPLLEESTALAREAGDSWCLAHALAMAGYQRGNRGELTATRRLFEECLQVARETGDKQSLRMGLTGLGWVTARQGDFRLAGPLLEEAVAVSTDLGEELGRATALQFLGWVTLGSGRYARAREALDEALILFREIDRADLLVIPLILLARVAHVVGELREARQLYDEALVLGRAGERVAALIGMSSLAVQEGDPGATRRLLEEALELARTGAEKLAEANALDALGGLARREGDAKRAAALHKEAFELRRGSGDATGIVDSVEAFAGLAAEDGRYEHAARLLAAAQAGREGNLYIRLPWQGSRYESHLALVREGLSAAELRTAFAEGRSLSLEDAAARASRGERNGTRPRTGWHSLTEREQQVAALVAEGLSNPVIAERLFVSPATVKTHVSSVFAKLGVAKRKEVARAVPSPDMRPS
ncbi:MAG: tetratricopeptide repeat protein [Solirubrobacteraceae bacterium]